MKLLFCIIIICLFIQFNHLSSISDNNLYILHTKIGDITCNYHNSRDLNNGWLGYYEAQTKKQKWIEGWKVDSITIINENGWTCGPKSKKIKYIVKADTN